MKWLNQLERKMGRHYISDLMKYMCLAMLGVFILEYLPLGKSAYMLLYFDRARILQGEIWRLVTFAFLPPSGSIIWIIFSLYFYYSLGTALEHSFGSARFNIYYALGILGNILSGFILGYATNNYLNMSLLLAYAVMYPNQVFTLFFILPVKVKWLGMFWGAYLIYQFLFISWPGKLAMLLSMLPFILFFGHSAWLQLRMEGRRLMRWINMRR